MKKECSKMLAVKMALLGLSRGIVGCPVCEFGHSPYDVLKNPEEYKNEIRLAKKQLANFNPPY